MLPLGPGAINSFLVEVLPNWLYREKSGHGIFAVI